MTRGPLVRAGGGVVCRLSNLGLPEVLVVHRPRYDDWSFPKGKADPGETDEQCALREVQEETGLLCTLGRELPQASYIDRRGRPKVVKYWTMDPVEGEFAPNDEVDQALWMILEDALEILSYHHDLTLVEELMEEEINTVSVLLVRHGTAGSRKAWVGDDRLRPLDQRGKLQADELVEKLSFYPIKRILSSGFLRCTQTVEPLASRLGIEIEIAKELEEGANPADLKALVNTLEGEVVVLSTHGGASETLLGQTAANKKGGVWLIRQKKAKLKPMRYLPPQG